MKRIIALIALLCIFANGITVSAAEINADVNIPTAVQVSKETGEFSFDIVVNSQENFAGMEYGVICASGCEITSVEYNIEAGSTGPTSANGVVWFGFFDGEDSFSGEIIATVKGICEEGIDSAISVQGIKKYTVGDNQYTQENIEINTIVNLVHESVVNEIEGDGVLMTEENVIEVNSTQAATTASDNTQEPATEAGDNGISANWQTAAMGIGAVVACALIYIVYISMKKSKRRKKK